jgi:multiple sugar transport system permease protein
VSYYIYNNAYEWFQMGYAAAIAWFLFLAILIVTLINWSFSQRLVHYE